MFKKIKIKIKIRYNKLNYYFKKVNSLFSQVENKIQ